MAYEAIYRKAGLVVDYTPSSAVAAGEVVIQGTLVGIATEPIDAGKLGALSVSGIFEMAKASEDLATVGTKVYWVAASNNVTATAGSNVYVGKTIAAAAEADATVLVRLEQ